MLHRGQTKGTQKLACDLDVTAKRRCAPAGLGLVLRMFALTHQRRTAHILHPHF